MSFKAAFQKVGDWAKAIGRDGTAKFVCGDAHMVFKFKSSGTEFWFDTIHNEKVILPLNNNPLQPRPCDRVEALTYPTAEVGAGNVIMLCNGANRPLSISPPWNNILPQYRNADISTGKIPTPPGLKRLDLYKSFLSRAILHECMHASDLVACESYLVPPRPYSNA